REPPLLHSCPTRRSSDLSRSSTVDTVVYAGFRAGKASRTSRTVRGSVVRHRTSITCASSSPDLRVLDTHALPHRQFTQILASLRSEEHTSELQSRFDLVC